MPLFHKSTPIYEYTYTCPHRWRRALWKVLVPYNPLRQYDVQGEEMSGAAGSGLVLVKMCWRCSPVEIEGWHIDYRLPEGQQVIRRGRVFTSAGELMEPD